MATKPPNRTAPKGSKAAALKHAQKIAHRDPAGQFKPPPGARKPTQTEPQIPDPEEFETYDPEEDLPYGA